jgi:hypothetical protein
MDSRGLPVECFGFKKIDLKTKWKFAIVKSLDFFILF